MLSYRHAFHAGNFADVHKHSVLCALLQCLLRKDAPFCYQDSHAGVGRYDLHSTEAQKNGEFRLGILRLWQRRSELPQALQAYLTAIAAFNPPEYSAEPRYYPGSPAIVRHFLRPQDRMILTELHPADFQQLQRLFTTDRQVAVHRLDGYQGLKAFLPPKERRGLVLIDPPFERRDETEQMLTGLRIAHQRWAQGIFALWFPITNRSALSRFYLGLEKTGIPKILSCEFWLTPPLTARRLNGSCMVIVNPPWQLDATVVELQACLTDTLGSADQSGHRITWLVGE